MKKQPTNQPTSYWLENGDMVFPFDTNAYALPPWVIMRRGQRMDIKNLSIDSVKPLSRFYGSDRSLGRYMTEREAREALRQYAKKHGLKPAYEKGAIW